MKNPIKLRLVSILTAGLLSLLITTLSQAEIRYVVDVLVVSLREGPDNSFASLKSLKTGDSFTLLDEQENFIKVETKEGLVGWLPTQYTTAKPPKAFLVDKLTQQVEKISKDKENLENKTKQLAEQLASKEQKINEVENRYSLIKKTENSDLISLQKQLDEITKEYESLVSQSETTIKTANERDFLAKNNAALLAKVASLEGENTNLANKQALYWFLAGGGVFIIGWIIGRVSSRRQRNSLTL
nr:TIGR04211 family SH3 domain-containing protein [Desulfobulbaceae bacterium]